MVRYKRYKRRGGSTSTIKMKFQSFMDIHTDATSMQIITISAGGKNLLNRCLPQFSAYKYYKLGSVSVKLVPASTLPVDPTGLSISAGNQTVDPRDQLTPGLMRITNGEDIFEDLTSLTETEQRNIYNAMMLDPRWFKWMLQSGVKRYAFPKFWQIGQLHQDKWPGATINYPYFSATTYASGDFEGTGNIQIHGGGGSGSGNGNVGGYYVQPGSDPRGLFQTGHSGRLGWLPTDGLAKVGGDEYPLIASPVEVEVMKIVLPRPYKTEYWYRAFITETVYFREPIVYYGAGYRPLDIFHIPSKPFPYLPDQGTSPQMNDEETGGNYGDD